MIYKLYHCDKGYLCKVSHQEILFLFGIEETEANEINNQLALLQCGYYIKV